ncbi:hypothetical protein UFOVP116_13 [uncultured Caudovirales phage]|uniref:Uncharacterized protein n=1 Tax=uncultured Caudovirales phage TaxID=2100421 RepID=A0A6J5L4S4_9CAUD|nr:hypothetical protein UFOVP116_13 [uncultured Caudovirales phage]
MRLTPGNAFGWTFHISNLRSGEMLKHSIDTPATLQQMSENEFILILSGPLVPVYESGMKQMPYERLLPGAAPFNDFPSCTTVWEKNSYTLHQAETAHQGFCISRLQNNGEMPSLEKLVLKAGESIDVGGKLLFLISGEMTAADKKFSEFTELDVKSNVTLQATSDCLGVFVSHRRV